VSDHSAIQWTDATWNPTTGCTKVSPGCAHCYIERTPAFRIAGRKFVNGATDLQLHANRIEQPLHWKKPRRVFVNSLSDLFHPDVPETFIDSVFAVMALAPQHTFQVLTKRPQRMRAYVNAIVDDRKRFTAWAANASRARIPQSIGRAGEAPPRWPLPNVWLGVSVENQRFADERIPLLLQTPAAVRFISAEPLLGPVDLYPQWMPPAGYTSCFPRLDWVIAGGESGPGARDCDLEWLRSLHRECAQAGVAFFLKQLGRQPRVGAGVYLNLRDKHGGDITEWPADVPCVREFPQQATR
jgi:protein gp37